MKKYKFNKLNLHGGSINCNANDKLDEKDCIQLDDPEISYINQLYERQMIYQDMISELDRFIIWFYTYTSFVFNMYIKYRFTSESFNHILGILIKFLVFFDLYNLPINEYKEYVERKVYVKTDITLHNFLIYLIELYNIFFYDVPLDIKDKIFLKLHKNQLTDDDISILLNILVYDTPNETNLSYMETFTNFIHHYCIRLNELILNAPRTTKNIILYRLDNNNHSEYELGKVKLMKYFVSTSCSKYNNFVEYIKNDDKSTYCFMVIKCEPNMPMLFTNRNTSYFGEHSFEVILPYNSKFHIYNKITDSICGYYGISSYPSYWYDTQNPNYEKYKLLETYLYNTYGNIDFITKNDADILYNNIKLSQFMKYFMIKKPNIKLDKLEPVSAVTKGDDVKIDNIDVIHIVYYDYDIISENI